MNAKDHFVPGLICGLVAPVLAFISYSKIKLPEEPISSVLRHATDLGILATMISVCVFTNLLVFFIFIWTKNDRSARGVLAATFLYALVVVILKLKP